LKQQVEATGLKQQVEATGSSNRFNQQVEATGLSEAQRLTANKYVGTARERALTPKSMGLTVRYNSGEKETTKANAG